MLENTNTKQSYPGPILNNTLDITNFLFRDPEQVKIQKTALDESGSTYNIALEYGTDYEVHKILPSDINIEDTNLTASTGQIILKSTVEVLQGEKLTAYRESALVQEVAYPRTGKFPAASHEGALDYLTMQNQEQQDQIDRAIKVPVTVTNFNMEIPQLEADKVLKVNAEGTGLEMSNYALDNITSTTKEYMESAQTAATEAAASKNAAAYSETQASTAANTATQKATEVNTTAIQALTDITTNKNEVIAKGAEQIELIQNEGATQVANVKSTGFYRKDDKLYFINSQGEETEFKSGGGLPIGTIIPVNATSNYVPNGSLPCDGAEYTKSQFSDLWNNYLSTSLLNTCTYTKYEQDIATYGQCGKFAVDTINNKFRVPLIKDGSVIQQALTNSELGKSYNAGLPNITGSASTTAIFNNTRNQGGTVGAITTAQTGTIALSSGGGQQGLYSLSFDASRANSTYGNSDTVQPNAVALRYFVVVANGQINQSMMDWSTWASSLQGKANTDLSNLSDSGKKVIDGQWVSKTATLSTATAVGTYTIDLSSYLPNDNYNYEVLISGDTKYTSTKTEFRNIFLYSDIITNTNFLFLGVRGNAKTEQMNNSFILPVKKKVYLNIANDVTTFNLYAQAYRRIGTNN